MGEMIRFGTTDLTVSRLALGTWVTGGWAWGGSDENEAKQAILKSFELGTNFIDTAPVYGFGKAEEIVGRALREWGREQIVVATKCGLQWDPQKRIRRNSSPERIFEEADGSLKRLGIDRIDLYQIHWPDPEVPFEDSLSALLKLQQQGKIRYFGLSNFSRDQIEECLKTTQIHSMQPPYNLFEREAERDILPFCKEHGIATLAYGGLCRGLLTGKFTGKEQFPKGDLRRQDPKFKPDRFKKYVAAANEIKALAASYGRTTAQFALQWAVQQPGVTCVLSGARTVRHAEDNAGASGFEIARKDLQKIEEILARHINEPVGPGFMSPSK
ncbi:MAG: aldo/keto reductase [Desulfobacteraceae bacterium]|nr:aldo/keto reductase [Desulfobacteraceae bacterium]